MSLDEDDEWIERLYEEWEMEQIEKMLEEADAEQKRKDAEPLSESGQDGDGCDSE